MKRLVYIVSFTVLGLLVATLVHAGIELPLLHLIVSDHATYGDSLWWRHWSIIHGMAGAALWVFGAVAGFKLGRHFWRRVYVAG